MAMTVGYPVRVQGRLDAPSRWLWLVKWLLALPHYIVLVFLWIGFVAVSLVAFVAVLATGRYPRALFDYNVGVLRWTWRVTYYAYGALGTDRYPPFSLDDVPDYPARLDIDYPDHLSRGLVLVKWWLLALPHYLVIGFFLGGSTWVAQQEDWTFNTGGPGLIGLLVLVAAVVLAVTGSYPRSVFDFVLGMNRWVLRVAAYAGLMTDAYPPFRLDMGGDDPGALAVQNRPAPPAGTVPDSPAVQAPPAPPPSAVSAGRVVGAVVVGIIGLTGLGLLAGGLGVLAVDRTQRDDTGYLTADWQRLSTGTAALVSEDIDLRIDGGPDVRADDLLGDVRLRVTSEGSRPVFVGIAEANAVRPYLGGFGHDVVTGVGLGDTTYRRVAGGATASAPTEQTLWAASTVGTGQQTLTWTPDDGRWVLVVMNADGLPGLTVTAQAGAEIPVLTWVAVGLLVGGGLIVLVSAVVVVLLLRR